MRDVGGRGGRADSSYRKGEWIGCEMEVCVCECVCACVCVREREREREKERRETICVRIVTYIYMCNIDHRSENAAEKMFAEMESKDGGSYDAIIQGLIKVIVLFIP